MSNDDILKLDLYEIIGVCRKATVSEINSAYRKKALDYHPDKCANDSGLFLQLKKAKDILTDPSARARYDRILKAREEGSSQYEDCGAWGIYFSELERVFSEFVQQLYEEQRRQEAFFYAQQQRYNFAQQTNSHGNNNRKKATMERLRKKLSRRKASAN